MIGPGEVQVWRFELERIAPAGVLDEEERRRAAAFRTDELRRRYTAAHAALHEVLERYSGGAALRFARGEYGKPYLVDSPLRFSLSHSRELALVAVALDAEVGVDVEQIREKADVLGIARRFLPPDEAAAVAAEPASFFRFWTRREAYLKALGIGIRGLGLPFAPEYSITELEAGPGYAAAVAVAAGGYAIRRFGFGG